ncbi:MAG TPA: putative zinc-binding protein [Burkholderiales bacterium]|nr:putative zinc-binding protein [Burkholderiales bacterium]
MRTDTPTFDLEVEETSLRCPVGEKYAAQHMRDGSIPVLSCEGPCIRGEIARQAANRVAKHVPFARACQGEAMTIPESGMARWVSGAEKVVVIDGCFLRCQARQMRRMLQPDQLIEIDALSLYKKYTDKFEIDDVPESERTAVADDVAEQVLATREPVVRR